MVFINLICIFDYKLIPHVKKLATLNYKPIVVLWEIVAVLFGCTVSILQGLARTAHRERPELGAEYSYDPEGLCVYNSLCCKCGKIHWAKYSFQLAP